MLLMASPWPEQPSDARNESWAPFLPRLPCLNFLGFHRRPQQALVTPHLAELHQSVALHEVGVLALQSNERAATS